MTVEYVKKNGPRSVEALYPAHTGDGTAHELAFNTPARDHAQSISPPSMKNPVVNGVITSACRYQRAAQPMRLIEPDGQSLRIGVAKSFEVLFLPPIWLRLTPSFHTQRDFPHRARLVRPNPYPSHSIRLKAVGAVKGPPNQNQLGKSEVGVALSWSSANRPVPVQTHRASTNRTGSRCKGGRSLAESGTVSVRSQTTNPLTKGHDRGY
jgi:hypothetical protein